MKTFFILAIIATTAFANPRERLESVIDTLNGTPASLTGSISVGEEVVLGQSKVSLGLLKPTAALKWRKSQSIGFQLNENDLTLQTDGALVIKVSGVIIRIKSIRVTSDGNFQIDVKSPVMEKTLERKIAEAVETKYKAKMNLAFRELSQIRKQKTGREAKEVIDRILGIFKEGTQPSMFDSVPMYGSVDLNFNFPQSRTLEITDKYVADIAAGDTISAGGTFSRINKRITINEFDFRSHRGVVFRPEKGSNLSLASVRVTSVKISDRGIEPVMVTGAEKTISEVGQLVALIASAEGVSSFGREPDCDPRIAEVQSFLQQKLNGQLVPLIRQHRTALIRAGIDPQVLEALGG